jgi:3-oxoacyl-[acyl-carrier-protein] synthase II
MIGHTLIAAGSIEAVIALLTIQTGILPPQSTTTTPIRISPGCRARRGPRQLRTVLSNSFGFGGQNVCVIFSGEPA